MKTFYIKQYNLGYLDTLLEGASRPGHFQGVCQVMERLLGIVQPDRLVLGQKDYQQCMVISKLVSLLGTPIEILIGETFKTRRWSCNEQQKFTPF